MSPVMAAAETIDDLYILEGRYYKKFTDAPFSGELKEGKSQGKIRAGKMEGKWTFYHDNGQISGRAYYKNGEPDGEIRDYDLNGKLNATINFQSGKLAGKFVMYKDGNVIFEREYKNDVLDGKEITYWTGSPTGRIRDEINYKLGKKHGVSASYYPNGKLKYEASYKSGKLNGPYVEYFENGTDIKEKGNYKDNERDGVWEFFDASGKKRFGPPKPISGAEIDKQIEKEIVKLREKIKERLKDGKKDSESFPWESDPIVESVLDKKDSDPPPWASLPAEVMDEGSGVYKDGKKVSP